jgi:hypothetical protein
MPFRAIFSMRSLDPKSFKAIGSRARLLPAARNVVSLKIPLSDVLHQATDGHLSVFLAASFEVAPQECHRWVTSGLPFQPLQEKRCTTVSIVVMAKHLEANDGFRQKLKETIHFIVLDGQAKPNDLSPPLRS